MRTIDEVRQSKLAKAAGIVAHTGMFATTGREMEFACRDLLADLCFIDSRDAEHEAARKRLERYGQLGVVGAFDAVFGSASNHVAEVASVFAEQFHALGYLEIGAARAESDWEEIRAGLADAHALTDTRRSAPIDHYGEPSLVVDQRVLCYVSDETPAKWIFFDCWKPNGEVYREGRGDAFGPYLVGDPLVRDIRVPAGTFDEGLILSLWGKFQRWGPTWRFDHPEQAGGGYPPGVREQLLAIQSQDPSQSLGPRRP